MDSKNSKVLFIPFFLFFFFRQFHITLVDFNLINSWSWTWTPGSVTPSSQVLGFQLCSCVLHSQSFFKRRAGKRKEVKVGREVDAAGSGRFRMDLCAIWGKWAGPIALDPSWSAQLNSWNFTNSYLVLWRYTCLHRGHHLKSCKLCPGWLA